MAMVSEVLVDQLMDVTLSSIWLAFLMINTRLILISPLLIIVIYGFIAAFTLYRFGVFVPVVERARSLRAGKLTAAKEFHRSPSLEGKSSRWEVTTVKRIGYRGVDYLGSWMDSISQSANMSRKARIFADNEAWGSMNRTSQLVGSAPTPTSHNSHMTMTTTMNASYDKTSQRSLETRDLAPGKVFPRTMSYGAHRLRLSSLQLKTMDIPHSVMALRSFHCLKAEKESQSNQYTDMDGVEGPSSASSEMPAISGIERSLEGGMAKSFRAQKEITTDPRVALRHMLTIHVLGSEAYGKGEQLSAFEIPEALKSVFFLSELEALLCSTFDTFYPNGSITTEDERSEAVELLRSWHSSLQMSSRSGSESDLSSGEIDIIRSSSRPPSPSQMDRISFPAFAEWFLRLAVLISTMHTLAGAGSETPLYEATGEDDVIPEMEPYLMSCSSDYLDVKSWW